MAGGRISACICRLTILLACRILHRIDLPCQSGSRVPMESSGVLARTYVSVWGYCDSVTVLCKRQQDHERPGCRDGIAPTSASNQNPATSTDFTAGSLSRLSPAEDNNNVLPELARLVLATSRNMQSTAISKYWASIDEIVALRTQRPQVSCTSPLTAAALCMTCIAKCEKQREPWRAGKSTRLLGQKQPQG